MHSLNAAVESLGVVALWEGECLQWIALSLKVELLHKVLVYPGVLLPLVEVLKLKVLL